MTDLQAPKTRPLPPGLTEDELAGALDAFAGVVGAEHVITSDEAAGRVARPVRVRDLGRVHGLGRGDARDRRGDPGDRPDREPVQGAALDPLGRQEQRLRRPGAAGARLGDPQPPADEQGARDQRGVRLRGRRARRPLVRPLRRAAGGRPQADGLRAGSRLGQRDRQHARPRRQLHALRRPPGQPVRDGGRAPERRPDAHRDGRDEREPRVERLQARARPVARRHVHAVQLRHRHEDGRLADAASPSATCRSGSRSGTTPISSP